MLAYALTSEQSTTGTDVGNWIAFTEPRMQVPSTRSENASRERPRESLARIDASAECNQASNSRPHNRPRLIN
ncbi:hypothetical protein C5167_026725 [Papaver somniferum]|nr:hypothetical protein C5167_026725 [Papaver somniferum]